MVDNITIVTCYDDEDNALTNLLHPETEEEAIHLVADSVAKNPSQMLYWLFNGREDNDREAALEKKALAMVPILKERAAEARRKERAERDAKLIEDARCRDLLRLAELKAKYPEGV